MGSSFWAQRIDESVRRADAVEAYNHEHPEAKYGFLAVWLRQMRIDPADAETASNGGVVTLARPEWATPEQTKNDSG